MSKAPGGAEKKEEHKPAGTGAPPAAEPKKSGAKGNSPLPGGCHSWGCKSPEKRFNFCEEHYDHFKFGLIKKSGEPVPDYEKKFEHYQAYKAKRAAHKVA
jgi:hypothetical protein